MAEIVRTETLIERGTSGQELRRDRRIHTRVTSIHGGTLDMLRDFLAALDGAGAPAGTLIDRRQDCGPPFVGLTAEWITYPDEPTEESA